MFNINKDIESALKNYPTLKIRVWNRQPILEGKFVAYNRQMDIEIETYDVMIQFMPTYPFAFPKVTETSYKIQPRNATRHIFKDDSLCFGNKFDEAKVCKNGITLSFFFENILNPHLCREYAREILGDYPTGERSHDMEGLWESFYELFGITDKEKILWHYRNILTNNLGRNDACYCCSGLKYKSCHLCRAQDILAIGRIKAEEIFNDLQNDFNKRK